MVEEKASPADPVPPLLLSLCSALVDAEASCIVSGKEDEGGADDGRMRAAGVSRTTAAAGEGMG